MVATPTDRKPKLTAVEKKAELANIETLKPVFTYVSDEGETFELPGIMKLKFSLFDLLNQAGEGNEKATVIFIRRAIDEVPGFEEAAEAMGLDELLLLIKAWVGGNNSGK